MAREAVIVDCARTAFGKRKGALAGWHPTDLLGLVLSHSSNATTSTPPASTMWWVAA
jgi:acetyl-CoA acetyltransferase